MNTRDAAQAEHEDIAPWLPWHLNRTLSAEESQRVDAHLVHCAQCRSDAALWHEALEVAAANEVEFDAGDARLSRLLTRIDADQAQPGSRPESFVTGTSPEETAWLTKLREFVFGLLGSPRRPLAAALTVAVAVLAGVLGTQLVGPPGEDIYEVRSDPIAGEAQLLVRLQLATPLSQEAIQSLLHDAGADFSWQRDANNQVLIALPAALPAGDVLTVIEALRAQSAVAAIETTIAEE